MSFSLGRSDTLGIDQHHNRRIPAADDSEFAIIPYMVTFGRIIRKVSVDIYHSQLPILQTLAMAVEIESELDGWIQSLPVCIRPSTSGSYTAKSTPLREQVWCRRQRLVLDLRESLFKHPFPALRFLLNNEGYRNVKLLLFRPYLLVHMQNPAPPNSPLVTASEKCMATAKQQIQIIHDAFKVLDYFRTW